MRHLTPQIVYAKTFHGRQDHKENAFHYGVNFILIPMAPRFDQEFRFFSQNRWNLSSFYDHDHGPGKADSAEWARQVALDFGLKKASTCQIWLLTQPRIAGYIFNPVSFWFFIQENNEVYAVLAEVNNTFGDRHSYLCFHDDQRPITPHDRIQAKKVFHVSPFQNVDGDYIFRFSFQQNKIGVWIKYKSETGGLYATLTGRTVAMTDKTVLKMLLKYPLGAARVIALIHWQAMKLAFKGVPYRTRPEPPKTEVSR